MKKLILATLLGMVALFVWQFIAWTVVMLHESTLSSYPGDTEVIKELTVNLPSTGVYYYPPMPAESGGEAMNAWVAQHKAGPLLTISIMKEGADPYNPLPFVWGIIINFLMVLLVAYILNRTLSAWPRYFQRVGFVIAFSVFAWLGSSALNSIWLYQPWDYSLVMLADLIIGWTLVGLILAWMIKPVSET